MEIDRVAEDTIVYELHLPVDADQQQQEKRMGYLKGKLDEYVAFVHTKDQDFFWNNEGFNLHLSNDTQYPHCLIGSTNYGDSVDDEWFIVHLLQELSEFDKELVIKLEDQDGQILLIEAADHIPKWLDPSNSDNRVFIYRGQMHIIPKIFGLNGYSHCDKLKAIKFLRDHSDETRASPEAQEAISTKANRHPEYHKQRLHRAKCYVPLAIASILDANPKLISHAVNTFYQRDPIDARSLRFMKHFPPEDRVMKTITFTRLLYAKLIHHNYVPDKRTRWKMPPKDAAEFKSHDLGMKLACGFEILLAGGKVDKEDCDVSEGISSVDFDSDEKWQKYKKNLSSYGYFRDELEGSKLYSDLLERAKISYYNAFITTDYGTRPLSPGAKSVELEVVALLASTSDYDKLKEEEALPINQIDDDDSWLNVTPEQLDQLLEECFITKRRKNIRPQDVTKLMKHFVGGDLATKSKKSGANNEERSKKLSSIFNRKSLSISDYMKLMDQELKSNNVGIEDFIPEKSRIAPKAKLDSDDDSDEEMEETVKLDTAVCHNLLEAYNAGLAASQPGAACNLLQSMGLRPSEANIKDID